MRATRMPRRAPFSLGALIVASLPSVAIAADLDMLTRVLIPAYIADDFAAICSTKNPDFLRGSLGAFQSTRIYADHVKVEVTSNLTEQEAFQVRKIAADVAKSITRNKFDNAAAKKDSSLGSAIASWCQEEAEPFIVKIVDTHQIKHREFDSIVERAKRGPQ